MANTIGSVIIEMAADIAGFKGSLREAVSATDRAVETIKKGFELIGVGLSVGALVEFTKSTIEFGNQLYVAATKASINAQALSELAFAARSSGVGLEELSTSLARMQKMISSAGSGVGAANVTLTALGLTFSELKTLTPDEQFTVFAQRISELASPADKTRAAMELFGRAGADLLPLFSDGAEGIAKARIEAGLLGQSLSADTVENLHKTQESLDRLTESLKGLGTAIVVEAAPALTSMSDRLTSHISSNRIKQLTADINDYTEAMSHKGEWSLEGIIGSGFSDRNLLSLQTQLNTLLLIQQTERDLKNQNINALLGDTTKPPGFGTDLTEIKINPNLKIREDSLKKFYDDLDAITQTGGEKLISDTALLQARLDLLVKDGIISQADAFNRARSPADTKALADFFASNKTIVDQSTKQMTDDFKVSFAAQSEAARLTGEKMRAEFEKTARFADQVSGAISNFFASAFLNIGQGGLRGLVADFAKAFASIVAQAEAVDLAKALGLGPSATGGSSILNSLAGLFTGSGGDSTDVTFNNGAGTASLLGFAGGGSFPVGGTGGTDSQLVQFRASPNERVTVSGPGQSAAPGIVFSPVYNIGSGVSRSDVISACQTTQKTTIAHMTKLIKGGAFA